ENGSNYGNTSWALKTGGTIVLGTTDLEFLQTAGSASYTAGTGLNLNGTTFSVDNSIAKKSEINSQDLQSVTDKGSTTTNNITLQKFVDNNTVSTKLNFGISSSKLYGIESYRGNTSNLLGLRITTYNGGTSRAMDVSPLGVITIDDLAGTGTRQVVADANGTLSTQQAEGTNITASLNNDVLSINSSTGSDATVDMTGLDAFYKLRPVNNSSFDFNSAKSLGVSILATTQTGVTNAPGWYTEGKRAIVTQLGNPST